MKKRKETINLQSANVASVAIMLGALAVVLGLYALVWHPDVSKEGFAMGMWVRPYGGLLFVVAMAVGIVVHELIHGATWACFAPSRWKSISFGVIWKMLTPYCHCSEPLLVRHYRIGALMPLYVLGVLPALAGIAIGSLALALYGVLFVGAAAGDIMVAWRLRKEAPESKVQDHPTEAGYWVYEED